ncbi:MAG: PhnD/SsuA/transferrin family substrate-binding protein [Planctomycetota bacterium]
MARRYGGFTVLGLCSALIVSAAGCQPGVGTSSGGRIVQIGSTKAIYIGLPAEFRALHPALEECFGGQVRFSAQPNGVALGQQLEQGGIAYAIMSAGEYAAVENPEKLTLLATGLNSLGKPASKALFVVKAKSHVKSIADCAGKRFAFGTHGDILTDLAAQRALEEAGVPVKKLLPELVPPPLAFDGRLYLKNDVPKVIITDLTVNAGVLDEITYNGMPETGGNVITGPSRDQFEIVGETVEVPGIVFVAGPAADPTDVNKLKDFLINHAKDKQKVCEQLGVTGFAPPDKSAYDAVRSFVSKPGG